MSHISIYYKNKTNLIDEILKKDNIKEITNSGLFKKIGFSKKEFADIYFHSGEIDDNSLEMINESKKTIVNSYATLNRLIFDNKIPEDKVEVIYPSINLNYEKPKEVKTRVCEDLGLNPKKRIIFFTAKNLKSSGVKEFIQTIFTLNENNFQAIIAGDSKQILNLKFQLSKFEFSDKIILLEDYKNIDELFLASDIFLLPTYNKIFASNILKAMYCKCAVFVSANNQAKEVIDVFATLEDPLDRATSFKIDALLMDKNELKKIKKQNRKIAKDFTLENNLLKLEKIISSI